MSNPLSVFHLQVKKRILALILLACILTAAVTIYMEHQKDAYSVGLPEERQPTFIEVSDPEVVEVQQDENTREFSFRARKPGDSVVRAGFGDRGNEEIREYRLHVGPDLRLSAGPGRFSGDRAIIFAVTVMFLACSFVAVYTAVEAHRKKHFSYDMVIADTLSLMLGFQTALLMYANLTGTDRSLSAFFTNLHALGSHFVNFTAPIMALLALWLFVSNIWLLKREGISRRNMLGIALGLLWASAYLCHIWLGQENSRESQVVWMILQTVVDYTIVYFECVLLALMFCGMRAAMHEPSFGKDCIVILGCQLRRNGTLTPLLKGRVDRALAFEKEQFEATGKHAVFIPSGGQGKNEIVSESSAMAQYLRSMGVPSERILEENRSRNTFQNMAFSKKLIEENMPGAAAAFSTTGYHVFRSMLLCNRNHFECEGMGSRTRWYYYPNAYLREILGLVYAHQGVLWGLLVVVGIYLIFGLLAQVQ